MVSFNFLSIIHFLFPVHSNYCQGSWFQRNFIQKQNQTSLVIDETWCPLLPRDLSLLKLGLSEGGTIKSIAYLETQAEWKSGEMWQLLWGVYVMFVTSVD